MTQAAILAALPPNQKGYLILLSAAFASFRSAGIAAASASSSFGGIIFVVVDMVNTKQYVLVPMLSIIQYSVAGSKEGRGTEGANQIQYTMIS